MPPEDRPGRHVPPRVLVLVAWLVLGAWLLATAYLTLTPAPSGSRVPGGPLCIQCGDQWLSNVIRNVLLFMPLGAALGLLSRRPGAMWALATLGSMGIEFLQLWIPGRNPLLVDLLSNSAGAAGGLLVGSGLRWMDALRRPRWVAMTLHPGTWLAGALGILVLTGALLSPVPTSAPVWIQWHPHLDHLEPYDGQVERLTLGDTDLPPGRVTDTRGLSQDLFGGETLVLQGVHGSDPEGLTPLLRIMGEDGRQLLLLARDRTDAVVYLPHRAEALGMAAPDLRLTGGFEGVRSHHEWILAFRQVGPATCLSVDGKGRCDLRPALGEGWALLLYSPSWSGTTRGLISALWLLLLAFPCGFLAREARGVAQGGPGRKKEPLPEGDLPVPGLVSWLEPGDLPLAGAPSSGRGRPGPRVPSPGRPATARARSSGGCFRHATSGCLRHVTC